MDDIYTIIIAALAVLSIILIVIVYDSYCIIKQLRLDVNRFQNLYEDKKEELQIELKKVFDLNKKLNDSIPKNTVEIIRTNKPLSYLEGVVDIPYEVFKEELNNYELYKIEQAIEYQIFEAFKQTILPSSNFMLDNDYFKYKQQFKYRIPYILQNNIDMSQPYPIISLIMDLYSNQER